VRLYGLRQWVEQRDKQVKHELGWADFQVRSDRAIRRHWQRVCCAFSCCWWALGRQGSARASGQASAQPTAAAAPVAGGKGATSGPARRRRRSEPAGALLASGAAGGAQLARPVEPALALRAGLVDGAPAARAARAP
jgi:hypothetical protein